MEHHWSDSRPATANYTRCLQGMVEPSPPAMHLLSNADGSMTCVGVKLERDDSSRGSGLVNDAQAPLGMSPSRDWLGNPPLVARQLTPPLSCSPLVRQATRHSLLSRHRISDIPQNECSRYCVFLFALLFRLSLYMPVFRNETNELEKHRWFCSAHSALKKRHMPVTPARAKLFQ